MNFFNVIFRQPPICKWNLNKLAESWSLMLEKKKLDEIQSKYDEIYKFYYNFIFSRKLGFFFSEETEDFDFIKQLYDLLEKYGFDLTIFFRTLSEVSIDDESKSININLY